jgi:hypothetical protein
MAAHDTTITKSIWICAVIAYLYGIDAVVGINEEGFGKSTYLVNVPEEDFEIIESDYNSKNLPLADAKGFVHAYNKVVGIQKDMRRRKETSWRSDRWIAGNCG